MSARGNAKRLARAIHRKTVARQQIEERECREAEKNSPLQPPRIIARTERRRRGAFYQPDRTFKVV